MLAVFRLVKNAVIHAVGNDALKQTAEQSAAILRDFCRLLGGDLVLTFIDDAVFVCGELVKGSRELFETARTLEQLLASCDTSELRFAPEVTAEDLLAFAEAFAMAVRTPTMRRRLLEADLKHIKVRKIEAELQRRDEALDTPQWERSLRLYATALVVMRRFCDAVAEGRPVRPHRLKRIAQRLVSLSQQDSASLLAVTSLAHAHRDDAGRAVQAAILVISLARQITSDGRALAQLAMTALMADIGRLRLAGIGGTRSAGPAVRIGQ